MEVRLLGPVAVVDDDRLLAVRQRRQRALLALLALRAGETVGIDQLVEELWGAEAPKTAVASLQNAVSQLRKVLGAGALVTREPGYALDSEHVTVDVGRFEHLLVEARAARSMQDEQTAAAILREALGLWRGPALADLAYEPFAQAEIRRLEELRQGALEERIDADLALGLHDDLVPELETLVLSEPLRERLHGQLMLALYRAERQADALAAYRSARSILVGELGIEPGPELRRLQAAILRQDESLRLVGAPPTTAGASMQFRRLATILVTDAVVSSRTQELDPESLHHLLAGYYETVVNVVGGHGGAAERMAGDAVMVAFGVATADENPALRAVRAAVDLRAAIDALNANAEALGARIDARSGVATGEVVVSGAGSRQQLVTGEAIGVAVALQQVAPAGEIVIGPLTRRLVGTAVTVEQLGELDVGSRAEPVTAYRLLGVSTEQPSFASLLDTPLVGRKRELRALRAGLREARAQSSVHAALVLGPPGIGKSRLAREILRDARGFDVAVGRCPSYGKGITYWPLRQIVGDDRDAIHAAVGDVRAAELLTRLDGPAPEIAWAFRRWCEARAARRPLLVVIDDLHWAEPTFLDLLEGLADNGTGPVVLLALAREELLEDRPGFLEGSPNADRVVLDGLAVADTETLVEELLAGAPLPIEVRARVFEVAEGNPLFVEQLVALAAEGDPLGTEQRLPATIQALLAARLDRLGPGERAVLERAAVVGREFTRAHVTALLEPVAVPTAARHLDSLARRGFVEMRPDGSLRFRHVLVQEAAYRAAPKKLRAELHERLADRLDEEGEAGDELVGYHLERAFRLRTELAPPDRAALKVAEDAGRRLAAAGLRAWSRHDAPAASNLLGRALVLLPASDRDRPGLLCELGLALKWMRAEAEAETVLREALTQATEASDERVAVRAELELAVARLLRGDANTNGLVELADRAVHVLHRHSDERGLGRAWMVKSMIDGSFRAHWAESAIAAEQAVGHYVAAGLAPTPCFTQLAIAARHGPEPVPEAVRRCEELIARVPEDTVTRRYVVTELAALYAMSGAFELGRALIREARASDAGRQTAPSYDWVLPAVYVETLVGDLTTAEAVLREACAWFEARSDATWLATFIAALAEVECLQHRFDEAHELAGRAAGLAHPDDVLVQGTWRRARARTAARSGDLTQALALAREANELFDETDALNERAATRLVSAEVLLLASGHGDATVAAEEGLALLRQKGNVAGLRHARAHLVEIGVGEVEGEGPVGSPPSVSL